MFWQPDRLLVKKGGGPEEELRFNRLGNGYSFEAAEVMNCLRQKNLESRIVPLAASMAVMVTLDDIRAQWGLSYAGEGKK